MVSTHKLAFSFPRAVCPEQRFQNRGYRPKQGCGQQGLEGRTGCRACKAAGSQGCRVAGLPGSQGRGFARLRAKATAPSPIRQGGCSTCGRADPNPCPNPNQPQAPRSDTIWPRQPTLPASIRTPTRRRSRKKACSPCRACSGCRRVRP